MTKAQIVNALISNKATRWVEADRAVLNSYAPAALVKMLPVVTRNDGGASPFPMTGPSGMTHSPDDFGSDGHNDNNGETVEDQAAAVMPGGAKKKPPQWDATGSAGHDGDTDNPADEEEKDMAANSVEAYINNAPSGMREVLQTSYQTHNRQKAKIIQQLTANSACKFSPQFLGQKSLQELQLLLNLAEGNKPRQTIQANYSGMGDGGGMSEEMQTNSEEVLTVPTLNFSKRAD